MKNTLIIISICFFAYGCCTKKDCDQIYNPEIVVKFKGFSNADLSKVSILLLDKYSFKKVDSIIYDNGFYNYRIYNGILSNKEIEIKDYSYIIKTNVSEDTIDQVKYDKYSETIKCNKCFPFGDGSATVINFKGFSFRHGKFQYIDNDTLNIKK